MAVVRAMLQSFKRRLLCLAALWQGCSASVVSLCTGVGCRSELDRYWLISMSAQRLAGYAYRLLLCAVCVALLLCLA